MARVIRKTGAGKQKLESILTGLQGNKVGKVGWFETAKYPDGTPVAYVASIQEFGSPQNGIHPRPFMRPTIAKRALSWKILAGQGARAMAQGKYSLSQILDGIGQQAAGDIARTISEIQSPRLKDATVKARMRRYADKRTVGNLTKPLVDTGYMISSIQSTVEDK